MMKNIDLLFGRMRFSSHTAYEQLILAVELASRDEHRPVTKNLSPDVARRCKSKAHRVERNLRSLRDKLWDNELRRLLLCNACGCYDILEERPKTAEFIEMLVQYNRAQTAQEEEMLQQQGQGLQNATRGTIPLSGH